MRFDWPTTKRIVHRHLALLLLLWWGGLNCLAGCLTTPTSVIGESQCPMSGEGGDCCLSQPGEDKSSSKSIAAPSTSLHHLDCCSLQLLSADVSRDVRAAHVVVTTAILSLIEFTSESEPRAKLPNQRVRIPDRGGTHLLNCVFLI